MKTASQPPEIPIKILSAKITLGFVALVPLYTYVLLILKGLPGFAISHQMDVIVWVYERTWLAALISGLVVSTIVSFVVKRTPYFHRPFDFGRCFSLGGIAGALAEAPATWIYRSISHRPFSNFWMAGASMAGFLAGATLVPFLLWYFSANARRVTL